MECNGLIKAFRKEIVFFFLLYLLIVLVVSKPWLATESIDLSSAKYYCKTIDSPKVTKGATLYFDFGYGKTKLSLIDQTCSRIADKLPSSSVKGERKRGSYELDRLFVDGVKIHDRFWSGAFGLFFALAFVYLSILATYRSMQRKRANG